MTRISICFLTVAFSTTLYGQVRDKGPISAGQAETRSDAASIAAGWNAVAAKQTEAAVGAADQVLRRRPWDRSAFLLKVTALAESASQRSLDVYDQWIASGHLDDAGLLEPIAIGVVKEIANGRAAELKRPAWRVLMGARVSGAQAAFDALPQDRQTQLERDTAAARGGDATAMQRLISQAAPSGGASPALAAAFRELGVAGEPGLLIMLTNANPQIRSAAAEALGNVDSDRSRSALRGLGQDADPMVRTAATIALAQLGDNTSMSTVERILNNGVPDMQIAASRAWKGQPGPWVSVIRALLDNPDGVTRIDAARAIAPVDPEAARRVLDSALADRNPVVRHEAADAIGPDLDREFAGLGLVRLRERLRDSDEAVRLAVAKVLLRLARS